MGRFTPDDAASGPAGFTDDFSIKIRADDTTAAPTDDATFAMAAIYADDIAEPGPATFHHASTQQSTNANSTVVLSRPTATTNGDLLLAHVGMSAATVLTITPPAGWTQLGSTQTVADTVAGVVLVLGVYAKIASSEPTQWTWTLSGNHLTEAASVLALTPPATGAQVPTLFAFTSGGDDNRTATQSYGTLPTHPASRNSMVGMLSFTRTHASAGWSVGPTNLTDRTGDVSAAGSNTADHQVWLGLNGSDAGEVTKTEADVYLSCVVSLIGAPLLHTETVSLGIGGFAEDTSAPSDSNLFTMRVWLSASAGSGVTNPSNADGQNNGTNAVVSTAVAGSATETLTSALGVNVPSGVTVTSVVYRGWFSSANTLVTSKGELTLHSSSALFSDILMFRNQDLNTTVDHTTGTFTFDVVAAGVDTLAKLQSCEVYHLTSDAVAGVTPHVLTVDAGCLEVTGAFT